MSAPHYATPGRAMHRPLPPNLHLHSESDPSIQTGAQFFPSANGFEIGTMTINHTQVSPQDKHANMQRVLSWLSGIDVRALQRDRLSKRTAGTGAWFVEGDAFRAWLEKRGKVLWVMGKPGAGKTFLTSTAIEKLESACVESKGERVTLFFFCQYKAKPSTHDILRSFLRQLYEQRHQETYDIINHIFEDSQASSMTQTRTLDILLHVMGLYKEVYLAIDALDELHRDTQDELLRIIWSMENASLLLTSRPMNPPGNLAPQREIVWLPIVEQNRHDIHLFVHHTLKTTGKFVDILGMENPIEGEIVEKIDTKASGMFLLASLQLESLKKCTTQRDLLTKADQLPTVADGLYELTMSRIEDQSGEEVTLAKTALLWVTYAHAYLTIDDLQSALATVSPEDGIDPLARPSETVILSCCCGLLVVDQATKAVRLSHFTADEFIRTRQDPVFKSPHSLIARHCIAYLASCRTAQDDEERIKFEYADLKWAAHAKQALSEGDDSIRDTISEFVLHCNDHSTQDISAPGWQRGQVSSLPPEVIQPVHLIALHGFSFLFDSPAIKAQWDLRTPTKRTALHYAAAENNFDLVQSLCSDKPSRVNEADDGGYTPLMFACRQGHGEVVKMLLPHTTTINARSKNHDESALILAAQYNHKDAVELLLTHPETDLHAQDSQGRTPLMIACNQKFPDVADFLLRCPSLDVNQCNAIGFTAFTETALGGSVDIFRRLLAHPNQAFNSSKDTALVRAVKLRKFKMAQYLLSLDVIDVNVRCAAKMSPLVAAAETGQETMFRRLLEHPQVDVNVQDEKGYTALMYAAEAGEHRFVELLLRRPDTEVNLVNRARMTALMLACSSKQRRRDIVDLFLDRKDVDLDARDNKGRTASMLASTPQDLIGKEISVSLLRSMTFGTGRKPLGAGGRR